MGARFLALAMYELERGRCGRALAATVAAAVLIAKEPGATDAGLAFIDPPSTSTEGRGAE